VSDPTASPSETYRQRFKDRRAQAVRLVRRDAWLSNSRLVVFLIGAIAAWGILVSEEWSGAWLPLPLIAYLALVFAHDLSRRASRKAQRAADFYARGLARLENRFAGTGRNDKQFAAPEHPYAGHLDLFGHGSVFELLSTAQTAAGEETLARWLLAPASPEEIRARNGAVRELRPRLQLREDLATLGPEVREGLHPATLVAWGEAPTRLAAAWLRAVAATLAALTLVALVGWLWVDTGPAPLMICVLLEAIFALAFRRQVRQVIAQVEHPTHDLILLSELLARLEQERFESERARQLRSAFDTNGVPPSVRIKRLRRTIELLDSRRNQLFAPVAPFLLWGTQCALAIEAWRARCGPALGRWLSAVGELEALLDLAGYAYENPADPFPELMEGEPRFEAEGIGHPLLPEGTCVRNDLALGPQRRLLLVTGSNMSGKSTLLRSVGVNVVLAQAGAPVRARSLRMSPLALGASVQIVDSLREGRSRFYAEITNLRRVVSLTEAPTPVLFVLHGTNSHDRRAGASAVVRGLVDRGAIGLVTTHDLALARIAEDLAPRAANVHFEDHLKGDKLLFDYKLRPGVVERSNALELMRAVGLEV
jgi:hypothetical protein